LFCLFIFLSCLLNKLSALSNCHAIESPEEKNVHRFRSHDNLPRNQLLGVHKDKIQLKVKSLQQHNNINNCAFFFPQTASLGFNFC
jgi:hypothetical protein